MQRWNQIFIASHKTFFLFFGAFGNLNLMYIILSTPKLRSKSSYLQFIQTSGQLLCVLNCLLDIYLMISDTRIRRDTCYSMIFPIVFGYCVQTTIMFFIILDILLGISFPISYRNVNTWKYVLGMSMGPIVWGVGLTYLEFQELDDELLILCSPALVLHKTASRLSFPVTVGMNTLTLVLFTVLIVFFRKKGRENSDCWKIMRHLKVSAALFIGSIYFSSCAASVFIFLGFTGEEYLDMMGNLALNATFSYSHTFYVIIWRSSEYRKRFIEIYWKSSQAWRPSIQTKNKPSATIVV